MERESFEDEEVADILNRDFVSIKVDREERPDVDHFYMEACMVFNGQGGWPLSVFLTHDKSPFFAGTYFPKENKHGILGFKTILQRIYDAWKTNNKQILESGKAIISYLKQSQKTDKEVGQDDEVLAYIQFKQSFDEEYGGFGNAPKFPSVQNLIFLINYGILHPEKNALKMVDKTLKSMATGGVFDHIGGGFYRYSTDRKWLVPHFEKMLYDNAMLLMIYSEASSIINDEYAGVTRRIAKYCMTEMLGEHGGFYTAQDADSESIEGKMYIWSPDEIIQILGQEDGQQFCKDYDITEKGNFENKSIPNRIGKGILPEDNRTERLLKQRNKRVPPLKDDKVLTSSNGLMIAALAVSGHLLSEPEWITEAEKTADFILENNIINGRLMARWREGNAAHAATLDDYAYFTWGLIELYQSTFKPKWLRLAIELTENMLSLFKDKNGGFFVSGNDVKDLPIRQKNYRDGALPCGNAIAASNLERLAAITENEQYRVEAYKVLSSAGNELSQIPMAYCGLLCADMLKENNINITIAADEDLGKMLSVLKDYNPYITTSICGKGFEEANSILPFAESKRALSGKTTAYVCSKAGCQPPTDDPDVLKILLKEVKLNDK